MTTQDRHDLNFVRKQITAIEIEMMPDKGEVTRVEFVASLIASIASCLGSLQERLEIGEQ